LPLAEPLEKLINYMLQPMEVVVGISAVASDAKTERLPEGEGPVVVTLQGADERAQPTVRGWQAVDGDVGRRR
jgi:hypothetical protein